ncbi:MAG: hydroxymethylpyrimidine/phosphomethylpyrimidine kinase [Pseudohongiellaceae bacterium]|jgi:hydroxymethylpyrimidine/phosphomethylpyrimidine kinase
MTTPTLNRSPIVMCINNHDPIGGAGISADIESLSSLGCHCTPIITQLSSLNNKRSDDDAADNQITPTSLLISQIRSTLEDTQVDLIKVGKLASEANIEAVHTVLSDYPSIPVVLAPFSGNIKDSDLNDAVCELLFPQALITLLSEKDAYQLTNGADSLAAYAHKLLEYGSENLLFTNASHKTSNQMVCNQLYNHRGLCQQYERERLAGQFNGGGDTLSAALSAYLGHGLSLAESMQQAQQFTWQAIKKAKRIGMGELIPDRMHWAND